MQESITASAGVDDNRQKEPTNKLQEGSCNIFAQISHACSFIRNMSTEKKALSTCSVLDVTFCRPTITPISCRHC